MDDNFHRSIAMLTKLSRHILVNWTSRVDCTSGSQVVYVGHTRLPYGQVPILLYNGEVTLQTQSGKVASVLLETHTHVFHENPQDLGPNQVVLCVCVCVKWCSLSLTVRWHHLTRITCKCSVSVCVCVCLCVYVFELFMWSRSSKISLSLSLSLSLPFSLSLQNLPLLFLLPLLFHHYHQQHTTNE